MEEEREGGISPLCSHFYPLYAIMADDDGGSARKMNLESGGGERKRVREISGDRVGRSWALVLLLS